MTLLIYVFGYGIIPISVTSDRGSTVESNAELKRRWCALSRSKPELVSEFESEVLSACGILQSCNTAQEKLDAFRHHKDCRRLAELLAEHAGNLGIQNTDHEKVMWTVKACFHLINTTES